MVVVQWCNSQISRAIWLVLGAIILYFLISPQSLLVALVWELFCAWVYDPFANLRCKHKCSDGIKDDDQTDSHQGAQVLNSHELLHPPNIPISATEPRFHEFIEDANQAFQNAYPRTIPEHCTRYTKVFALLLQWEEDDLGVCTEVQKLEKVLTGYYGFETSIFQIPEKQSQRKLTDKILDFVHDAVEEHLLIVYYGGHSEQHKEHLKWRSNQHSNAVVNWTFAQPYLLNCSADSLLLLDTCYAAIGGRDMMNCSEGVNEVISASNEDAPAPGVSRLSFTQVLVRTLKDFAEHHRKGQNLLSAAALYSYMCTRCYPGPLKKMPHYARLSKTATFSCPIVPRGTSPYRFTQSTAPVKEAEEDPVMILASIHLRSTPRGDIVEWLQGEGVPPQAIYKVQILHIQVASVYASHSAIVIFKCPIAVWVLLPPRKSCTYIGMVTSDDKLRDMALQGTDTDAALIEPNLDVVKVAFRPRVGSLLPDYRPDSEDLARHYENPLTQINANFHLEFNLYLPLSANEIRLVKVLPGRSNEHVDAALVTVPLADAPAYTAVSYVWRAGYDSETDGTRVNISGTPADIVRALRLEHETRYLWIDQCCINSQDQREKFSQLVQMKNIYAGAAMICVWLGPQTVYSQQNIILIERLANEVQMTPLVGGAKAARAVSALLEILKNRWFSRLWVLQEICVNRNVYLHYGTDSMAWSVLQQTVNLVRHALLFILMGLDKEFNTQQRNFLLEFDEQPAVQLLKLSGALHTTSLSMTRLKDENTLLHFACACVSGVSMEDLSGTSLLSLAFASYPLVSTTEQQSYLHELLQTLPDEAGMDKQELIVSLHWDVKLTSHRGLPVTTWYVPTIRLLIKHWKSLDIIAYTSRHNALGLPSWCPDLRTDAFKFSDSNVRYRVGSDNLLKDPYRFHASGKSRPFQDHAQLHDLRLRVGGFICETIVSKTITAEGGTIPLDWIDFAGWQDRRSAPPDYFWRTLVADCDNRGNEAPPVYGSACHSVLQDALRATSEYQVKVLESRQESVEAEFMRRVQSVIWKRCMIRTKSGKFGIGPKETEPGDVVVILYGLSIPVILRASQTASESGETRYVLIGQAYIDGIMNGEALPYRLESDRWEPESFITIV